MFYGIFFKYRYIVFEISVQPASVGASLHSPTAYGGESPRQGAAKRNAYNAETLKNWITILVFCQ